MAPRKKIEKDDKIQRKMEFIASDTGMSLADLEKQRENIEHGNPVRTDEGFVLYRFDKDGNVKKGKDDHPYKVKLSNEAIADFKKYFAKPESVVTPLFVKNMLDNDFMPYANDINLKTSEGKDITVNGRALFYVTKDKEGKETVKMKTFQPSIPMTTADDLKARMEAEKDAAASILNGFSVMRDPKAIAGKEKPYADEKAFMEFYEKLGPDDKTRDAALARVDGFLKQNNLNWDKLTAEAKNYVVAKLARVNVLGKELPDGVNVTANIKMDPELYNGYIRVPSKVYVDGTKEKRYFVCRPYVNQKLEDAAIRVASEGVKAVPDYLTIGKADKDGRLEIPFGAEVFKLDATDLRSLVETGICMPVTSYADKLDENKKKIPLKNSKGELQTKKVGDRELPLYEQYSHRVLPELETVSRGFEKKDKADNVILGKDSPVLGSYSVRAIRDVVYKESQDGRVYTSTVAIADSATRKEMESRREQFKATGERTKEALNGNYAINTKVGVAVNAEGKRTIKDTELTDAQFKCLTEGIPFALEAKDRKGKDETFVIYPSDRFGEPYRVLTGDRAKAFIEINGDKMKDALEYNTKRESASKGKRFSEEAGDFLLDEPEEKAEKAEKKETKKAAAKKAEAKKTEEKPKVKKGRKV